MGGGPPRLAEGRAEGNQAGQGEQRGVRTPAEAWLRNWRDAGCRRHLAQWNAHEDEQPESIAESIASSSVSGGGGFRSSSLWLPAPAARSARGQQAMAGPSGASLVGEVEAAVAWRAHRIGHRSAHGVLLAVHGAALGSVEDKEVERGCGAGGAEGKQGLPAGAGEGAGGRALRCASSRPAGQLEGGGRLRKGGSRTER